MANVNCPNCGASLPVDPEKVTSALYCMHCGTRITDFDDLVLETMKHQQQMERDTLLHEQEMERIEAEAKLETKRARRIAVEKGTRAAVRSTNGCIGFITKSHYAYKDYLLIHHMVHTTFCLNHFPSSMEKLRHQILIPYHKLSLLEQPICPL